MKFIDYYAILEVNQTASHKEIKSAYRKQAFKWHPDKNNTDTSSRMQQINEAYLILNDPEARKKYALEYKRYNLKNKETQFEFEDTILINWIKSAQKQSVELTKQALDDLIDVAKSGTKGALLGIKTELASLLIFGLIILLIRGCV